MSSAKKKTAGKEAAKPDVKAPRLPKAEVKKIIDQAYGKLARLVESRSEADRLLLQALEAARATEKQHRKSPWGTDREGWKQSVETAARYFVVKWYLDPRKIRDALEATQTRLDCLYASALRLFAEQNGFQKLDFSDVQQLDYTEDIAPCRD